MSQKRALKLRGLPLSLELLHGRLYFRQEVDIDTWVGPTFEVPHAMTGPFTVGREGALGSAPSIVCMPSTESLERMLCQLLAAYSRLEIIATRPDNVTASMYLAMVDVLAVKQLPVVVLSVKPAVSFHFSTEPDSEQITGNILSRCCTTVKGYLLLYCVATCSGHYSGLLHAKY